MVKFLSSREHPRVHLCCAAPTFMLLLKYHASSVSLHLKLSLHFRIQYFWCAQMIILSIPDFRFSATILNPVDVFRRWCKLSLRPMRDQVKSRHFLNRQARRDHIFTFYKYIGIISYKQPGQLFGNLFGFIVTFELDLEIHNSNLVQKIPNWLYY